MTIGMATWPVTCPKNMAKKTIKADFTGYCKVLLFLYSIFQFHLFTHIFSKRTHSNGNNNAMIQQWGVGRFKRDPIQQWGVGRFKRDPVQQWGVGRFKRDPVQQWGVGRFKRGPVQQWGVGRFKRGPVQQWGVGRFKRDFPTDV